MNVQRAQYGDIAVLAVAGRLDQQTSESFQTTLLDAIGDEQAGLVLDLSGLEYISSVGLRALMIGAKQSKAAGKSLSVAALQSVVKEVFQISRFDKVIATFDTTRDALAALSESAAAAYDAR